MFRIDFDALGERAEVVAAVAAAVDPDALAGGPDEAVTPNAGRSRREQRCRTIPAGSPNAVADGMA